jgi:hypothetical protein
MAVAVGNASHCKLPFPAISGRSVTMTKPITKPTRQPLIHHPSDVLDLFGHYDSTNQSWLDFDDSVSQQLLQFESENRQYIRLRPQLDRRSFKS